MYMQKGKYAFKSVCKFRDVKCGKISFGNILKFLIQHQIKIKRKRSIYKIRVEMKLFLKNPFMFFYSIFIIKFISLLFCKRTESEMV